MVVKSKFSPGQRVCIIDGKQNGRVSGVLVTKHGITYMCRWWDGTNFQENDFDDIELEALEKTPDLVMYCEEPHLDLEPHGEDPAI